MADFLGVALAFPMRPDGRGGLALSRGVDAVEDSLRAIIESMKGSHLIEPWLGLPPFVFKPMNDLYAVAEIVKDAIVDGDDRVDAQSLRVEVQIGDEGKMNVAVTYSIRGDATDRTLEHGFRLLD